jgi:hypothetical protein
MGLHLGFAMGGLVFEIFSQQELREVDLDLQTSQWVVDLNRLSEPESSSES